MANTVGDDYNIMKGEDEIASVSSSDSSGIYFSGSILSIKPWNTSDSDKVPVLVRRISNLDKSSHEIDFLRDDAREITYSRRIALHLMKSYKWYNPNLAIEDQDDATVSTSREIEYDDRSTHSLESSYNDMRDIEEKGSMSRYKWLMSSTKKEESLYVDEVEKVVQPYLELEKEGNSCLDELDKKKGKSYLEHLEHLGKHQQPSLEMAWAFFDHVTLPRYLYKQKRSKSKKAQCPSEESVIHRLKRMIRGNEQMDLANPGENRFLTRLYSPIYTPMNQMGDFGLGVGLYFSTLRFITLLTFIAGVINIPNILYFSSDTYSGKQPNVPWLLKGSALCTIQQWVPCPTCSIDDFSDDYKHRLAISSSYYNEDVVFALKNNCDMEQTSILSLGMVNYATTLFMICGMVFMNIYQKKKEVHFDEDEQTAQDYSIVISNPPPTATDPAEWQTSFEKEFDGVHVTCCTVALNNAVLIQSLVQRRDILQTLRHLIPEGKQINTAGIKSQNCAPWRFEMFNLSMLSQEILDKRGVVEGLGAWLGILSDVPELFDRLLKVNVKIRALSERTYVATKVYVTFETEAGQRRVLSALSNNWDCNRTYNPKEEYSLLFPSTHTLHVKEADEPSDVRWLDLSQTFRDRALKGFLTTYVCICAMILVAFVVHLCRHSSPMYTAGVISGFNIAFPQFALMLTNYERHSSESRKQTSLYVKIAAFRWVNTAVVITIITPFTSTLTDGTNNILDRVYAIFVSEILMTNIIQLADPSGFFNRHILAPRANTQEAMNLLMQGSGYDLAERYTNMTKILFLAFYYCAIYPASFFMCALATFVTYYVDSFSVMRTWKQAPRMGTKISSFQRRYFFSFAVAVMAVMSSYAWSGFPYDNLCETESTTGTYYGTYFVQPIGNKSTQFEVSISSDTPSYHFCSQDFMNRQTGFKFPAFSKYQQYGDKWMTDDQETLSEVYGWTSLCIVAGVCLYFVVQFLKYKKKILVCSYEAVGDDQGIPFSHVASISAYIPQVRSDHFPYPLLAVESSNGIFDDLCEWRNPEKPYSYYDLTRDFNEVFMGSLISPEKNEAKKLFSRVKHWPPNKKI